MGIVHIQYLLRTDGSILPGVLASSFCVVPVSSGSPNTASSSLFVHVELGTQTGLVQLIALSQQCTASFKDLHIIGGSRRYWQLFSSIDPYTVVSNCCCNVIFLCDLCGDSLGSFFFHGMSGGFISLHAKPNKTHVLWTWVL